MICFGLETFKSFFIFFIFIYFYYKPLLILILNRMYTVVNICSTTLLFWREGSIEITVTGNNNFALNFFPYLSCFKIECACHLSNVLSCYIS